MNRNELARIAQAMVAKGKGILAADESGGTIKKRFDAIGLNSTEEHRRSYREMLFTAAGADESISGVILYDETIRQKTREGTPFPQYLTQHGMIPGIKVDLGAKPLAGFPGETITEGLDGLRERLIEYRSLGARFAKWRAVIDIAAAIPTPFAIEANAHALARYAALCQENDIVPIVEPEVLMDGDHSIERCEQVTNDTLNAVFNQLFADIGNYLIAKVPPLFVSLVLVWVARRVIRPRRRPAFVAGLFAPLLLVASFFIPTQHRHVQAATPDVLYLEAIGGLIRTQFGFTDQSRQLRPRVRQSLPVVLAQPPSGARRRPNILFIILESVRADAVCIEPESHCRRTPYSDAVVPDRQHCQSREDRTPADCPGLPAAPPSGRHQQPPRRGEEHDHRRELLTSRR